MKRIISTLLSLLLTMSLLLGISVSASAQTDERLYPEAPLLLETVDAEYPGFMLVTQTENLALYVNEANVNISVLNKKTGMIWSSLVTESKLPGLSTQARYNSLIVLGVSSANTNGNLKYVYSDEMLDVTRIESEAYRAIEEDASYKYDYVEIDYASVPNGIRFTAYFNRRMGDIIVLDISLKETERNGEKKEYLEVCFDTKSSTYKGDMEVLINVGIMPYFGAATDNDSGYVFYPDGSGTISEFTTNHANTDAGWQRLFPYLQNSVVSKDWEIPNVGYGILQANEKNGVMPALYPVFGMKKGNEAMFAIITEGEEYTAIKYDPSGYICNLSRVYAECYTNYTWYTNNDISSLKYRGEMFRDKTYTIQYLFLDGEDADYSGMAQEYRDYLIENDLLIDRISDEDEMPLALDIYMNTSESTIFGDSPIIMTTFDQAKAMLEQLHDDGVEDMLINISAWQEYGDSMGKVIPVYSRIGGLSGLKSMLESTTEFGYDVFMQVNMMCAKSSTADFKITRDAAKDTLGLAFVHRGVYFIAPQAMTNRLESVYEAYFKDVDISGFNYEMMAYYIYDYFYNDVLYHRDECKELCTKLLELSRDEMGKNAVWYGNQYSLAYADWIYDLPITDTGYASTTREVPFAQIVLHGYIPYSAIAGNTFYDDTLQTLKWIEYGYIPYYKLTNESTSNLANTEMSVLFSAKFDDWADRLVEKYKMMKENFGDLYNETIVNHDKIRDDVFVTTYSNGTKVIVNYSDQAYTTVYGTVQGESYLIVKD